MFGFSVRSSDLLVCELEKIIRKKTELVLVCASLIALRTGTWKRRLKFTQTFGRAIQPV